MLELSASSDWKRGPISSMEECTGGWFFGIGRSLSFLVLASDGALPTAEHLLLTSVRIYARKICQSLFFPFLFPAPTC